MSEPDQTGWKPWRWPGEWMHEEKFWRDVGTRTFAGMITAAILYSGAVLLGYLGAPHIVGALGYVVACVAIVLLAIWAVIEAVSIAAHRRRGEPLLPSIVAVGIAVVLIAGLVAFVFTELLR